jgi:hypothetical protein
MAFERGECGVFLFLGPNAACGEGAWLAGSLVCELGD